MTSVRYKKKFLLGSFSVAKFGIGPARHVGPENHITQYSHWAPTDYWFTISNMRTEFQDVDKGSKKPLFVSCGSNTSIFGRHCPKSFVRREKERFQVKSKILRKKEREFNLRACKSDL